MSKKSIEEVENDNVDLPEKDSIGAYSPSSRYLHWIDREAIAIIVGVREQSNDSTYHSILSRVVQDL
jgi:hypothetical protein